MPSPGGRIDGGSELYALLHLVLGEAVEVELIKHRKAEKLRRRRSEMPVPFFCTSSGGYADPSNVQRAFGAVLEEANLPHFTRTG